MDEFPEHVAKANLESRGIVVPDGAVVGQDDDLPTIDGSAVVKAQIPVSGRGTKGGIKFVDEQDELRDAVSAIFGSIIDGHRVERVLIEDRIEVERELYLSFSTDGAGTAPELIFSEHGGADVENLPASDVASIPIHPLVGVQPNHLRRAIDRVGSDISWRDCYPAATAAWSMLVEGDHRLVEINPLGITADDRVVALDAKVVVDSAAAYRQNRDELDSTLTSLESEAAEDGVYLRVGDGEVGILSTGAGLGMATLDLLAESGCSFAGFIDTRGAQFDQEHVRSFLEYLKKAGASVVVVNLFGSMVDCSEVASELVAAADDGFELPIVTRFTGTREAKAYEIVDEGGLTGTSDVDEFVEAAMAVTAGGRD